jgi:hypothetical protein
MFSQFAPFGPVKALSAKKSQRIAWFGLGASERNEICLRR